MQPFLINARSSSDSFVTMVSTSLSYITDSHPVHTRTGTPPAATSVAACSPPLSVTSRGRSSCRRDSLRGGDGGVDGGGRVDPLGDLVAAGLAHQRTKFHTRSGSNPAEGRPHTAVKQDCRKVSHTSLVTIQPPASSCQLRRGSPHHVAQPLSTGWVHTRHWGVDDIAASCISRVATAACTEGGGTSEGGTHSVEIQTELLPASPSSHSSPASLQLERTRS
jgi:hypothetical protein